MKPSLIALTLVTLAVAAVAIVQLPRASRADGNAASPWAQWKQGPPADPSYFPIAVWLQSPSNAAKYRAAGINLYVALWDGPTEEQLAALKKAGMPVICSQNAVALKHLDDPTIVGWMHGDEPDNAQSDGKGGWGPCVPPQKIVDDYGRIRAADPSRPVMLNLGQGVANDQWYGRGTGAKLSDYETYVKGGDVISFDVYPVVGINKPDGENYLWYVAKGLDRLNQWTAGSKIIWNCMECTRIDNPDKRPTPAQVRAEVWMSLVHGTRGLIWFVHQFKPTFCEWALLQDPEMLAAVTAINKQIQQLAPVLNSPTNVDAAKVESASANVPVDAMVKRQGGSTYVFSVGMRNAPTKATFTVRDLPADATAEVIGEGRSIPVKAGRFEDDFAAYAVHLYKIK